MDRRGQSQARLVFLCIIAVGAHLGCGSGRNTGLKPSEQIGAIVGDKIVCDAFLYDVKHVQDGKPTSIRLDCYRVDSVMGFAGRGYLGKGAFRGRVTRDSLVMYFPAANEFWAGRLDSLASASDDSGACIATLQNALVSILDPSGATLSRESWLSTSEGDTFSGSPISEHSTQQGREAPVLRQYHKGPCHMDVWYRTYQGIYCASSLEIKDGRGFRITGMLRERRFSVKVTLDKFEPRIPYDAVATSIFETTPLD